MFKYLIGMAASAMTASAIVEDTIENTAEMVCQTIATPDGAFFSISKLENEKFYEAAVTGSTDKLQFNYCTYGIIDDDAFGLVVASDDSTTVVASKNVGWTTAATLEDTDGKNTGVTFSQKSSTVCDGETKYTMRTNLYCDATITAEGEAQVVSVTKNGCEYVVELKHKAGCPTVDLDIDTYLGWLADNQWAVGIIYLILGPVVALRGLAWFPYVTASLMAIFVIGIVLSFSLAMSWMVTTTGTIVTFCVALLLGIIAGMVIRRNIWIMIGVLGLIAGFFSGSLIYALIFGLTGWKAVWGYWLISVAMAVALCFASCKLGSSLILVCTAFTGSYLFMRSWTLFFPGNWPSEAEIMQEDFTLETGAVFWVFFGVFVAGFIGSMVYQSKYASKHEDLDEYDRQ